MRADRQMIARIGGVFSSGGTGAAVARLRFLISCFLEVQPEKPFGLRAAKNLPAQNKNKFPCDIRRE